MSQDPRELDRAPVPPRGCGDLLTDPLSPFPLSPAASEPTRFNLVTARLGVPAADLAEAAGMMGDLGFKIGGLSDHFAVIDEAVEFARENG